MATQQISGITATDGARVFAGTNTTNNIHIGNVSSTLPFAENAPFNAYSRADDLCLPQTREHVLDSIRAWIHRNDKKNILWLTGWAGAGKSTIARTIAREAYDAGLWTASFFFVKNGGDVGHGRLLVSTIAQQLASRQANFRSLLQEAVAQDKGIVYRMLNDQWKELVTDLIARMDHTSTPSPVFIVIDALDECESKSDVQQILRILTRASELGAARLRVLIAGRPELHIRFGIAQFADGSCHEIILHNVPEDTVNGDIEILFRQSLVAHDFDNATFAKLVHKSWASSRGLISLVDS